jgi:hypothetical protein
MTPHPWAKFYGCPPDLEVGWSTCYYSFTVKLKGDYSSAGLYDHWHFANINDAPEIFVGVKNDGISGLNWTVSAVEGVGAEFNTGVNMQNDTWYKITMCVINNGAGS